MSSTSTGLSVACRAPHSWASGCMGGQPFLKQPAVSSGEAGPKLVHRVHRAFAPRRVEMLNPAAERHRPHPALLGRGHDLIVDEPMPIALVGHNPGAVP